MFVKEIKRGQACIKSSIFWSPIQGFPATELWLINTRKLTKHQEKITHLYHSFPCVARISNTMCTEERVRSDSDRSDWWADFSHTIRRLDDKQWVYQTQTLNYCTSPAFYHQAENGSFFFPAAYFESFTFTAKKAWGLHRAVCRLMDHTGTGYWY